MDKNNYFIVVLQVRCLAHYLQSHGKPEVHFYRVSDKVFYCTIVVALWCHSCGSGLS